MKDEIGLSNINLDDLIDVAILAHGFMPYKRDYYFHIETMWKDELAGQYIVIFKHCYSLNYETIADENLLNQSWDECFIDYNEYLNNRIRQIFENILRKNTIKKQKTDSYR